MCLTAAVSTATAALTTNMMPHTIWDSDLYSTIALLRKHRLSGEQGSSRISLSSNLKLTPSLPTAAIISVKSP
jgi:hypothetical protein